ncbi:MAG: LysR family transcriptional regulator [Dysgonamonadaceae bacterium]|nr:LysR family transcriptional regulator [Dysgonamonadaceae bacterium]
MARFLLYNCKEGKMHRPYRIANKLEIEKNHVCFLNPKRIELLKLIHSEGSILSASKVLRMSYQQAWMIIRDINYSASLPVVVRQRGGTNGGGAIITDYGQKLIERYDMLQAKFQSCLSDLDEELQALCTF